MILFIWLVRGLDMLAGLLFRTPRLKGSPPVPAGPRISVIFASRDEGERVRRALERLLAQDYPDYEIVAVNDRSSDADALILHSISDPRLRVLDVETLPAGWLGKTHALHEGYRASSGEWLLFTDADVQMDSGALSAAVAAVRERGLDHLTVAPDLELESWIEAVFTNFFTLQFSLRYRPWAARDRLMPAYAGIGAFNFVRREAYEKAGTHERLALEIADDMMLGKIVKRAGFRSMFATAGGLVRVRWIEGFAGVLSSLQKNAFRGLEYSVPLLAAATGYLFLMDVVPFFGLFLASGALRAASAGSVAVIFALYAAGQRTNRTSLATFPAHPLAAVFFLFILWRSALTALGEGGVRWRGTFYPLKELKKFR
ncbi:MAG TPA: glycosyltransferase family 2 protein, partial [Candidatus Eisenbacteria bacterium]|nr:glycosyltransferase family 2 protein [Candidatus Eisenbacteria bacterium]